MKQKLLFLHLWKSAGTSLHDFFRSILPGYRVVSAENRVLAEAWLANHSGVGGHFLFEHVAASLTRDEVFSVTVLRDPVQRVISQFHFNRLHIDQALTVSEGDSLKEALLRSIDRGTREQFSLLANTQVAVLAGAARTSMDPEERFGAALENLHCFTCVGQTEHLEAFGNIISARFGVTPSPPIRRLNARSEQSCSDVVPEDVLSLVKEANRLDARLWEMAGKIEIAKAPVLTKENAWVRFGNGDATIGHLHVLVKPIEGVVEIDVEVNVSAPGCYTFGFRFVDDLGATLFGTTLAMLGIPLGGVVGSENVRITCDFSGVAGGDYTLDVSLNDEWSVCDAWNAVDRICWQRAPEKLQVGCMVIGARAERL
ncbi:MAG: Wzt carbohydrate-binding domain-containing protein [Opitutaceae bacterium]|nr:Wzt carbohydrate-binding domain-containing protein [Opitutaceae bacterium]